VKLIERTTQVLSTVKEEGSVALVWHKASPAEASLGQINEKSAGWFRITVWGIVKFERNTVAAGVVVAAVGDVVKSSDGIVGGVMSASF
jgi:hypothetical protein